MGSSAKIWEKLNKELGTQAFFRADEKAKFKLDVINFPSIAMGSAIGIWGAPRGKIILLEAGENSGKTFLTLLQIIEAQKEPGAEQVLIDTELSFNAEWAKSIGVDLSRLHILPINDGVEIMTALCGKFNKEGTKKTVPGVLDLAISKDLNVNLLILDSIPDMQPPQEAGRNFDDAEIAPLPKFLGRALRFLRPMLVQANVAMIAINHLRDSMNGGPPTSPGGRNLKHNSDCIIRIHACNGKDDTLFDSSGKKVGHKVIMTTQKCRFAVNKHQAEIWLDFTKGVVKKGMECAHLGHAYGIINRPNLMVWEYNGKTIKGKDNFYAYLEENEEIMNEIIVKIKEKKEAGFDPNVEVSDEAKKEAIKVAAEPIDDTDDEVAE